MGSEVGAAGDRCACVISGVGDTLPFMRTLPLILAAALLAPPAHAAGPEDARAFVARVIAYETSGKSNMRSAAYLNLLTPALAGAIRRDMAGSEIGVIDYDPLCQCQDDGGLALRIVALRETGAGQASAELEATTDGAQARRLTLRLVKLRRGWRIADIATAELPSLRAALAQPQG